VGPDGWRADDEFEVAWENPAQEYAPIAAVETELCPASSEPGSSTCRRATVERAGLQSVRVKVPTSGEWALRLWLRDAAGNESRTLATPPLTLRYDSTAPDVALRPVDPSDPTLVQVRATDAVSGIERGEIEIRQAGDSAWRTLVTSPATGGFTARVDDDAAPDGVYKIRARAVDRAGNERSTTTFTNGRAPSSVYRSGSRRP
jgi:hypothetical protein